jgi:L-lactate dehydrogenase complex protein LldF
MIHPDVAKAGDESERGQDGRRLDHAEATTRPIGAEPKAKAVREAQPRGAKIRGNRPIDQAEAAERFLAAPLHQKAHDERLWDLRKKRDTAAFGIPEWEELRDLASQIKAHTLSNLDRYLEEFEANAKANGVHVHWAADGAEHNRIVHSILKDHGAKSLIKSKSMLTEECGFRHYMAGTGIEVIETDLG